MVAFGKRETGSTAPDWRGRGRFSVSDRPARLPSSAGPSPQELERVRFWRRVVIGAPLVHVGLAVVLGLVLMSSPFLMVVLAMIPGMNIIGFGLLLILLVVVSGLTLAPLIGLFVLARHEAKHPSGFSGYMRKNPSIYLVSTVLAIIWFGYFSGHDLSDLLSDFSVRKVLVLGEGAENQTNPWSDFWGYMIVATLGTALLFYLLDKYLCDRASES